MSQENTQLSMWSHKPIVHVALSLKGAKFDPEAQPVKSLGDYEPGQRIRMVIEGRIDDKVTEDASEAGQILFVSATISRAYDIDDDALAESLLAKGAEKAQEALSKRLGAAFDDVVGNAYAGDRDIDVTISHTTAEGKTESVKTTTGEIHDLAGKMARSAGR